MSMLVSALLFFAGVVLIGVWVKERPSAATSAELVKRRVMTAPEQVLFHLLRKALTPRYQVLAQVSFGRFLDAKGGNNQDRFRLRATVRQKVADFVICDSAFNVLSVIELDDKSHSKEKDNARDATLQKAHIPVVRYNVKSMPTAEQIKEDFLRTTADDSNREILERSENGTEPALGRRTGERIGM